jgi:hypothetical protein
MSENNQRENGYYWIKTNDWTIAMYNDGNWWLFNVPYPLLEMHIGEIDENKLER